MTTAVRTPPHRSAFSAAFLSFLFPGLGQAYAGWYARAAAFALPALIGTAVVLGLYLNYGLVDFGLWLGQTSVLGPFAVLNAILLAYRAVGSVDAYRLAVEPPVAGSAGLSRRIGRRPGQVDPLSLVGVAAILVVLVAGHVIVGYWDLKLYNFTKDVHAPVVIDTSSPDVSAEPEPTVTFPPQETFAPQPTTQPWNKTGRLNILVVGVDEQGRGAFRTDTMMVVSIDPKTHQTRMFSMPRDTYALPMPPKSRLSALWGPTFNFKLNALWKYSDKFRNLFPNGGVDALKQALGYAFFGDQNAISYYVLVNFDGFQKVVDTFGGVTIDVPAPVIDDGYPGNDRSGQHYRVYIPAGIQHMNGDQALTYARSRKGSGYYNDYNRSARQQQILVALEQQANLGQVSAHLSDLVDALSETVHTDIPEGPDVLGPLIELAKQIKPNDIKTYAFSPPGYGYADLNGSEYVFVPDVGAIRTTVKGALSGAKNPDQLQAAIDEQAPVVVENGIGVSGQETSLATYLQALGLNAQASTDQPAQLGGTTRLLSINGAAAQYPATFLRLEATLGLSGQPATDASAVVQTITDPNLGVQFVIITGTNTPTFTAPPG